MCDANKIEIGGKTTIYSTAVHAVLFSFLTTTLDPSITFLPNSRVTITTELREFMNGTTRLGFMSYMMQMYIYRQVMDLQHIHFMAQIMYLLMKEHH